MNVSPSTAELLKVAGADAAFLRKLGGPDRVLDALDRRIASLDDIDKRLTRIEAQRAAEAARARAS